MLRSIVNMDTEKYEDEKSKFSNESNPAHFSLHPPVKRSITPDPRYGCSDSRRQSIGCSSIYTENEDCFEANYYTHPRAILHCVCVISSRGRYRSRARTTKAIFRSPFHRSIPLTTAAACTLGLTRPAQSTLEDRYSSINKYTDRPREWISCVIEWAFEDVDDGTRKSALAVAIMH